jgi:hypothetical protein
VALGEFDPHGKLELAVVNAGSNTVGYLEGNGDETFRPEVTYSTGTTPCAVAIGDFNGDGKLDLPSLLIRNSASALLRAMIFAMGEEIFSRI